MKPASEPKQGNLELPADEAETQFLAEQSPYEVPPEDPGSPQSIDEILTGSLPAPKTEATLASIITEPGTLAGESETPPAEVGSEALRQAAERGEASAQFIVATRYLDGEGVAQDLTQAAHWYQKAALAGLAPAQYRLATLFERGRGVPQDAATAMGWYQRAAEQGNVKDMHNAAVIAAGPSCKQLRYRLQWFCCIQNG